jgi:hypothetical protein
MKKLFAVGKFFIIFLIITGWVFSGWPEILKFPPKVDKASAAIAYDASSESHTGTTGSASQASFSWTHTPIGAPKGVVVFVFSAGTKGSTNPVTGVTYGGVTMTDLGASYAAADTATELGSVKTFFLGSSIPTGAKSIVVSRTNNTTIMYAIAYTITALTSDTEIVGGVVENNNQTLTETNVDDGSPGTNSLRLAALYTGANSPRTVGSNTTGGPSIDLGAYACQVAMETTPGQGSRPVGFVYTTSDDVAAVYLAVKESGPGIAGSLGKTIDGWAGAIPVYGTLTGGLSNGDYPYARAQVTTIASQTFYTSMTWSSANSRFEGVIYPGSNYCMGCDDPKTYNGSFSVVVQLDNASNFSSIDYSDSAGTFTTIITLKRSSMDNLTATNYTDFNAIWSTDHWNISIDDFSFSLNSGSGSNIAVAIPIHPASSSPSNFAVTYNGTSVSQGSAASTTNAWWWDSGSHVLYVQFASLTTTMVDVDIDFDSDTDLFATRYNWTYTADMGSRKFSNGLYIANKYLTTFYYGRPFSTTDNNVACSGNECEGTGMQAESRAHEDGGADESTDCMERVAVHVDDTALSDGTTYYQYDIKWNQSEWADWIVEEDNDHFVMVVNSDNTASTGWAQQLNNDIAVQRTQTFYSGERYIKNVYDLTNNDTSAHKYPLVWEREQWHGTDRATNDKGRFYGDTSDVVMEQRVSMSGYSKPWQTTYDLGTFINMGVIYDKNNLPDYGIFAVEPFLAPTAYEWPISITPGHSTQTADQTGFEKTWSSVAASETVSLTFWHVHNAESSWADIATAMNEDSDELNSSTFDQSAYRWFDNLDATNVGAPLASQNISATLGSVGDSFRLRTLLHVGGSAFPAGGENFKLQIATSTTGNCTSTLSNFVDVATSSGEIRFYDNATPINGALLSATSTDPTHNSDTIVNQLYLESNNLFTATSSIPSGQDGKWDFSLKDYSAPSGRVYCFRIVKSDNSLLDSYGVIPEIMAATGTASISLSISTSTVDLGILVPGVENTATSTATVTVSGLSNGYYLAIKRDDADTTLDLSTDAATNFPDYTAWDPTANSNNGNATTTPGYTFSFRVQQTGTDFYNTTWWGANDTAGTAEFAGFPASSLKIMECDIGGSCDNGTTDTRIKYRLDAPISQKVGSYNGSITITALENL